MSVWDRIVYTRAEEKRLTAKLEEFRQKLGPIPDPAPPWQRSARKLLASAKLALKHHDVDLGWRHLHASQREAIAGMDAPLLRTQVIELLSEASSDKLKKWRADAIKLLLEGQAAANIPLEDLRLRVHRATDVRDEHTDNLYHKSYFMRAQAILVSITAGVLVVAVLAASWLEPARKEPVNLLGLHAMAMYVLYGALGACFTTLRSLWRAQPESSIPDRVGHFILTVSRPVMGSVGGIVAALLVNTAVISIGGTTLAHALLAAFAGGFSETLISGALDKLGSKT